MLEGRFLCEGWEECGGWLEVVLFDALPVPVPVISVDLTDIR